MCAQNLNFDPRLLFGRKFFGQEQEQAQTQLEAGMVRVWI